MTPAVFIDGGHGTTGLEIRERLVERLDLTLLELPDALRKDDAARREALNEAHVSILCLPDEAARDAAAMIDNPRARVIDASSAHRTARDWVYGFPELEPEQRARIAAATRVTNPGCYPTGFLALVRPLIRAGLLPADFPLTVNAVSGYSGGGKAMIAEFERSDLQAAQTVVRAYALNLAHKHVREMQMHAGLVHPPLFAPSVGRYYRGMVVEVPLQLWALPKTVAPRDLYAALAETYRGSALVTVADYESADTPQSLNAEAMARRDGMTLYVFGNDKTRQARLIAVLDNLGKGAAGQAVQNLNLMLGLNETEGLLL